MSVDMVAQELEPSAMSVSAVEILQRTHAREGWRQLLVEAAEYAEEREPQPGAPADAGFHALVSTGDSDMLVPPEEAVRLHRVISEGRLSIIPGARPGPNSVDWRLFAEAVTGFLAMNSEDEH
jgi:pimeloyl-ACP methyl ester carboxylesterase